MRNPYEIEICVDSLESAIGAQECGADRVELCARLDLDGLTPEIELIQKVRDALDIDVHVIIRPISGSFEASVLVLEVMLRSIEACHEIGVDGIVAGVLNKDRSIDMEGLAELKNGAFGKNFTFHRAFDVCKNPNTTLDQLMSFKINRLLTSGQADQAINGIDLIGRLVQQSEGKTGIMAGSGVNASNIPALWNVGVRQFHFTSHVANAKGKLIFDPSKTRAVKDVLESLCDT
jgi:copper homeostasis protein